MIRSRCSKAHGFGVVPARRAAMQGRRFYERASRSSLVASSILVGLGMLLSGCLLPPVASQSVLAYSGDAPDPAINGLQGSQYAVVYATDSYTNPGSGNLTSSGWQHIPSYLTVPGTAISAYEEDALPTPPSASDGIYAWAPTVRFISGQYLMMFSESIPGRANCIGAAKSSTGGVFTPINSWTFCSGTSTVGYLDPDLFVDPATGDTWLTYSRQWWTGPVGNQAADTPESEIDSIQIDPTGILSGADNCPFGPLPDCGLLSTNYLMLSFQDISANISNSSDQTPGSVGTNDRIENPALVADPYNGYDLSVSLGSWWLPNYTTVEIPCILPYGECVPSLGAPLMYQDGEGGVTRAEGGATNFQMYNSPGGASYLNDGSPNGNVMIWASFRNPGTCGTSLTPICAVRDDWTGPTTSDNLNGLYNGNPINGVQSRPLLRKGQVLPLATATQPVDATPHDWVPRVQNEQYPNVPIGPLPTPATLSQAEAAKVR